MGFGMIVPVRRRFNELALLTYLLTIISSEVEAGPAALPVPADNKWLGNDGSWSPIAIQIGTPLQSIDVFPSTSGQETLVVGLNGCDGSFQCRSARGGLFEANSSSTFRSAGDYALGLGPDLNPDSAAYYGLDKIAIDGAVSEDDQIVAIVNSTEYWTGVFGLGFDNTTIGARQASSYLSSLVQSQQIPGHSYGYTAGAVYRLKQVPASLTLGGYDANRFEPNDASFQLTSDAHPVVAINSITLDGLDNTALMDADDQSLFNIDSTTPFMWLPEPVANKFGAALGLEYNDTLDLFTYPNKSQYNHVASSKLNFIFDLAEIPGEPTKLSLNLTGGAFTSQNLTFGFPGLEQADEDFSIPYFPIRKAANSTQYTLGRCFLQETYLTVDYDRNNFSLSQAIFSLDATVDVLITDILPPNSDRGGEVPTPRPGPSNSLSTGTKVGIAVGIIAIVVCVLTLTMVFYLHRRRKPDQKTVSSQSSFQSDSPARKGLARLLLGTNRQGTIVSELPAREADPSSRRTNVFSRRNKRKAVEVDGTNDIKELPAPVATMVELPGSPVLEQKRRSSIAKTGLHNSNKEQPARTCISSATGSAPPSEGVSMPSPGVTDFLDLSSSTGPSPDSTNSNTVSSLSSEKNPKLALRQASTRSDAPRYTLDDSQTFELKPTDSRPAGLVTPESSQVESYRRFSWENSM